MNDELVVGRIVKLSDDSLARRIRNARSSQAQRVMPLIGQLLDAWDGLPGDLKGEVGDTSPSLKATIAQIKRAIGEVG